MSSAAIPSTLARDAIPTATKDHFASVPWCMAVFADPELVPVRLPSSQTSSSQTTFADPTLYTTHSQSFYKPALPPSPASSVLPSLTPYEPYRPSLLSTLGQLHTLVALSYDIRDFSSQGLEDLATALLLRQGRAFTASDPHPSVAATKLVDFSVRLRKVLRPGAPALCRAWKARSEGKRYVVAADLVFGPGEVLASAEMVFVLGEGSRL